MNFTRILYRQEGRKAIITLNRPEKRNALDETMVAELTGAFLAAGREPSVKVALLCAAGPAFCAGADLEYLQRIADQSLEANREDSGKLATLFRTIYELRKPVIAVVQGPALAGGCGLATVCDFILAGETRSQFGYTEAHIGFVPAVVMTFLIRRVGEGRARELTLRGHLLSAREAFAIGLVSNVVSDEVLSAEADKLAEILMSENSGTSMALTKELIAKLGGLNLVDGLDFASNLNAAARMTPDCRSGIGNFLLHKNQEW
ncbi:MAG TPA: enoyl-CoA hydratase-related protein [Bacteroidota bacterium]|nr:enoyl-CoA hydratase-related protein [Bacteroidota bacterium]